MSGHSKWATTKHKKAVVDAKRGKLFAKLIKNVEVAARTGGGDPAGNPTLYDAIQKAKKSSVPNDNIDRAVRRGSGAEAGGAQYENITYEGYAPGGVAVLVQCLTDNRNRAASDVRTAFSRNGGSMADPGSVSYLFHRKGVIVVEKDGVTEDDVLTAVLDAGAEEVNDLGESFEVVSEPTDLVAARKALQDAGIDYDSADTAFLPTVEVDLDEEQAQAGVPADRGARGLRRRAGRVRQLLGRRRHHGEARLTADVIIRPLTPALTGTQYVDLTMRSFGPVDEAEDPGGPIEPIVAAGRCLGAFDGGQLVGTALYHDMRQWWHGRPVPMAGVAGVKVAPEYRGQGVGRAADDRARQLMTERGYPLSVLYPATMTIYRSLGWEIAGHRHEAVLPARALSALARPDHEGRRRDQAPRPGRRRRGARGHRPRPRGRPRLRPDHLGRGHRAPLADPPRPVRRPGPLRLPGPGRLPRLPLAARPRRDLRRAGGGGLGRDHPGAVGGGRVQLLGGRDGARAGRPVRSRSGGCCASRTRTSPTGRAGCSACSTRPPPSPPAASPRRTSPYRCRSPMTCWRPTRAGGS